MSERPDDLALWRKLLASGEARAVAGLVRALREDPSLVPEVVPLAFSQDPLVRASALRAFARVGETHPRILAPYVPTILDAAAEAATATASSSAPRLVEAPVDPGRMQITVSARGTRHGRANEDPPVEGDVPHLLFGTLTEMFQVLLATGWTPDVARAPDPYRGWKAMPVETMEDVLEGVVYLLEVIHRDADHERPWSPAEVFEILLKRAVPLAVPLSVHKVSESTAVVEAGAPIVAAPPDVPFDSWPAIVGPFVQLLGHYVHPGFSFVPVKELQPHDGADGRRERSGNPARTVRFLATTAEATTRTS